MSMELLGQPYLEEFYTRAEADRARAHHLEGLLTLYPWIASIDTFQHWVYTHPEHDRRERRAAWSRIRTQQGGGEDWLGYRDARELMWHRQGHLFGAPFYYIEYGIAQTGALQVWRNAKRDRRGAIAAYRSAERLGWTRPLPGLFRAAKLKFDFGASTIGPLVRSAMADLERIDG